MRISTKGQYGVEALLYMALHPEVERWKAKAVAEAIGIQERYLEQIFHLLKKDNVLTTARGPKGGYYLTYSPEHTTTGQIIRAVEGDIIPVPCVACKEACTCGIQDSCATRTLWCQLLDEINSVIDQTTLLDLVKHYHQMEVENENID